jgi:hypothetical protein
LREVTFDGSLKFYGLDALDFFGDGSFYLIDLPGHTIGHIGGLVRTTSNPDTFAILSGDLYHNSGELRPSPFKSLPRQITFNPEHKPDHWKRSTCPCSAFEGLQTKRGRTANEPFFEVTSGYDVVVANDTLKRTQLPDAQDHIIVLSAHDDALIGVADFFPKAANNWKELGWKEKIEWVFLKDYTKAVDLAD